MKLFHRWWVVLTLIMLGTGLGAARDLYVSLNGTNNPPYTSWPGAATNIQWAVNAAAAGETVWVTNGIYNLTNRITISQAITNRSVNGPTATFINGNLPAYSNGCFVLQSNVYFTGFTITNGYATANSGGGIEIVAAGSNSVVSNCVIAGNYCSYAAGGGGGIGIDLSALNTIVANCIISNNHVYGGRGGGIWMRNGTIVGSLIITNTATNGGAYGGGIYMWGGTVSNCIIQANITTNNGGGIYVDLGYIYNSTITQNRAALTHIFLGGGGITIVSGLVKDCIISSNSIEYFGGGVSTHGAATLQNCIISGNSAIYYGGGIMIYSTDTLVQNCLIEKNVTSDKGGGILYNVDNAIVRECTIVSNRSGSGGGIWGSAATPHSFENNIIYANTATTESNNYWGAFIATNSCSYPLLDGTGNITDDPKFVNKDTGNWRLSANSPCLNKGTNQSWMTTAVDLDGRMRIRYGRVDMGAYERIYEGTIYKFH